MMEGKINNWKEGNKSCHEEERRKRIKLRGEGGEKMRHKNGRKNKKSQYKGK